MKVLFLTQRLPYAPNRGDRNRAYHLLKEMARWADVHLLSLVHDAAEQAQAATIARAASVTTARTQRLHSVAAAIVSLVTGRPLTHAFLNAPGLRSLVGRAVDRIRPDVIVASGSGMGFYALLQARRGYPFVLDMVDVDSTKWHELAGRCGGLRRLVYAREARTLRRFESVACREAAATFVVNDRERRLLDEREEGLNVHVVPIGVNLETFRRPRRHVTTEAVVFSGVFNYAPNVAGAIWLGRDVWPLVQAERPSARLVLVGASPTRAVQGLARHDRTIQVTGSVPDVKPYLWTASVAAAPLHLARGVQTKVFESVAAGLPTVITSAVAEGLPPELLPACLVADTAQEFARHLITMLTTSSGTRAALVRRARVERLSWERQLSGLRPLLETGVFGSDLTAGVR